MWLKCAKCGQSTMILNVNKLTSDKVRNMFSLYICIKKSGYFLSKNSYKIHSSAVSDYSTSRASRWLENCIYEIYMF